MIFVKTIQKPNKRDTEKVEKPIFEGILLFQDILLLTSIRVLINCDILSRYN